MRWNQSYYMNKKEEKCKMKYGVGINISKGKSVVSIISQAGDVIDLPFEINYDSNRLKILKNTIDKYLKEDIRIVM